MRTLIRRSSETSFASASMAFMMKFGSIQIPGLQQRTKEFK